jgi:hypothetical protein
MSLALSNNFRISDYNATEILITHEYERYELYENPYEENSIRPSPVEILSWYYLRRGIAGISVILQT